MVAETSSQRNAPCTNNLLARTTHRAMDELAAIAFTPQTSTRNTHLALEPWGPCLAFRALIAGEEF
jgi:hypothetical protein